MTVVKIKIDYTKNADGWNNGPLTPKGIMVHSTATPGVMAQRFRDRWDRPGVGASVHAFLDDKEIIQCLPWDKKAGHCGGRANSTHIGFEICEPGGFHYEGNEQVGYDVEKNAEYFGKIWENAVELCVYLCKEYKIDPISGILCHSEGYDKGVASNHADVMHWFPKHGKDMDDFRADVKNRLENESDDMTYEKFVEYMIRYENERAQAAPSDWSGDARAWAEEMGIIKGTGDGKLSYKAPLTREEYVEMEFRQRNAEK